MRHTNMQTALTLVAFYGTLLVSSAVVWNAMEVMR